VKGNRVMCKFCESSDVVDIYKGKEHFNALYVGYEDKVIIVGTSNSLDGVFLTYDLEIKFCPMCGREL